MDSVSDKSTAGDAPDGSAPVARAQDKKADTKVSPPAKADAKPEQKAQVPVPARPEPSLPPRESHRQAQFKISLKPSFVLLTVIISLASSAAIHFPWMYTATNNVRDLVARLNQEIIQDISSEVQVLMESSVRIQQSVAETIERGAIDYRDKDGILDYFFPLLTNHPHISWVSLGQDDGNFFGVNRSTPGNYQKVKSYWDPQVEQAQRIYEKFAEQDGKFFETRTSAEQRRYDARERPWYKLADALPAASTDAVWTDVYIFATSGQPGLNTARRLFVDGFPVGVVSIAIELNRLSSFLADKFVGKPGTAVVLGPDGSMLAFVDPNEVTHQVGGETDRPQLRPLAESYHPLLQIASQAIGKGGMSLEGLDGFAHSEILDANGDRYHVTLAPLDHQGWTVATIVPEDAFLSSIKENNQTLIFITTAALFMVAIIAILVARHLVIKPVTGMIRQAEAVEQFQLGEVKPVKTMISELDDLSHAFQQMSRGLGSFRKYLPAELVQTLVENEQLAEVGGINRTMTIYFSDLEGFTTLSEMYGPALVPHLSDYLDKMSREIHGEKGIIDKFIGDAIMAFWGAPIVNDNQATDACRAALRCVRALELACEQKNADGIPVFKARIGLNTGRVIVGNIGSDFRMDYTVLGDPVNLAARLEGLNKSYGTRILIGATTFEFAKYEIVARKVDTVNVKGKDQKTPIYELLAMRDYPGAIMEGYNWIGVYEAGIDKLERQDFESALEDFKAVIAARGGEDGPAEVMVRRCMDGINGTTNTRQPWV